SGRTWLVSFQVRLGSVESDLNVITVQAGGPHLQGLRRVFQVAAVIQAEVLLVERGGHHQSALEVAEQAAADDVGAGFRIAVLDGEHTFLAERIRRQVEDRQLAALMPGDHAGVRDQVAAPTEAVPGGRLGEGAEGRVVIGTERAGLVHHSSSVAISESSSARAGRRWPRSRTKRRSGSPRWSLTKVRKRLSFSGSLRALAHSHS